MEERISRTRKKKAALAVQALGERLVGLKERQLAGIAMPEELREAVQQARRCKQHEARRRQLQFIGSLMRRIDAQEIARALASIAEQDYGAARRFKEIERWRDELVSGNAERRAWLQAHFPALNTQKLDDLLSGAQGQSARLTQREAGRKLFRFLRELRESA